MTLPSDPRELREALEAAFGGRATIGVPELAALIPLHRETIARHVAAGNLVGRLKGLGRARRHRVFTIADVTRFLQLLTEIDRTMSLYRPKRSPFWHYDFSSTVIDFPARPNSGMRMTRPAFEEARRPTRKSHRRPDPRRRRRAADAQGRVRSLAQHARRHAGRRQEQGRARSPGRDHRRQNLSARHNDDVVARMVEERAKDVRRDSAPTTRAGSSIGRSRRPRSIAPSTLLRRVVRRARDNWNAAIVREPVWKKHRLKETKRPVREISAAEETALDALEDLDFAELRRFAIITGLRRANLLLTWPQVDFELGVVRVITKGGVPRVLPLSAEAYADLVEAPRPASGISVFTFKAGAPGAARITARCRSRGERYPDHLLRPRLAQARDLEGRRRRRADPRPAPHHRHAHAAQNRQPARGAEDPRPYRHCDHGEILHRRDARGHARGDGSDRAAPGRAEQTKGDRTERRLG
jgi:hypothetical protein